MQIPDPPRVGLAERGVQYLMMAKGLAIIALNRARERLGRSYYPCRDPWAAGLDSYTVPQQRRSLRLPSWQGPGWCTVGQVACRGGTLVFGDPMGFPEFCPSLAVEVKQVPTGKHRLELQRRRIGRGYGRVVLRARIWWGAEDDLDFECIGAISVDSAAICVTDAALARQIAPEQAEAAGFDAFEVKPAGADYAVVRPICSIPLSLHVFESGFGDGAYPLFLARRGGESCGVLLDMTGLLTEEGHLEEDARSRGSRIVSVRHLTRRGRSG